MKYNPYYLKDVIRASEEEKFTVISTFAGGGGSSTGYRLGGGKVLCINEFVDAAVDTYSANYPDTIVLPGDIKELAGEDFLKATNIKSGELDILDGSPPCSAFSVAGKREKGWGQEKKYSDNKIQESIEDLFLEFVRVAKEIQPKIIIAENVKGITFGAAQQKLRLFVKHFEKIGYDVTYEVLNGADYGTPQARERTIFVCVRSDVCDKIGLSFLNLHNLFPKKTSEHIGLADAIGDIKNDPEEIQMLRDYVQNSYQKKFIEPLRFNPEKVLKPSDKENESWNPKLSCFNMIRPTRHLPCPTLTQQGQKRGMSGVFHYEDNRKFTIKECIRIMAFPEDYVLTGTWDQKVERLCRAVTPLMYKALSDSLYENILNPYYNSL